jgi:penicillin-binding protein 2
VIDARRIIRVSQILAAQYNKISWIMYNWGVFMKRTLFFLGLSFLFLTGCSVQAFPLGLEGDYDLRAVLEPTADLNSVATVAPPTVVVEEDAGGYARAFYRAWEGRDYLGMYSVLSEQSQNLVGSEDFVARYDEAMKTAAVQSIHAQPLSLVQDGDQAEFGVRLTLETAVVGPITRDFTVPLVYEDGRWGIVWSEGLILPELEGGNRLLMETKVPSRASIYDKDAYALAFQGKAVSLGIIPGQIQDEAGLLAVLSPLLNKTPEEIKTMYATALSDWYVPIGDISESAMQENILALQPYIDAGLATPRARGSRLYTDTGMAPHLIGYMGFIPAEQLAEYQAQGYQGEEKVGLSGLEAWGEDYLNGERGGLLSVVGPNGEYISTIAEREPKQSRSIYTTFDHDFQAAVERALAEAVSTNPAGHSGAIVVMNVNTGDVLAMASYPSYDPVIFDPLRPQSEGELVTVLNDAGRPLLNRAAQGVYPAGSLFKVVTFTAGVNSGLYTPDTYYNSTGTWSRLGEAYTKRDWREGGHGNITLKHALVVSCNSCFYDVGYNLDAWDNTFFPGVAREFGLGRPTGIQGVSESPGLIPDPQWKLDTIGEGWATGDSVNMAIGQGYVQVTPLQIATIFAAIANGGTLYQPKLIDRIGAGGGAPEEVWPVRENGRLPLSDDLLSIMRNSLWDVANGSWGTATHRFQELPVKVAGKTGTAEAPPGLSHAWFAGYAPAAPYTRADGTVVDQPEIAVAVIVENAGEGSVVAAPIFRRVVELYYGIEPLAPYPW